MKLFSLLFLLVVSNVIIAQEYIEKKITTSEGLSSNFTLDVTWDKYGFLWISTENGINRFDGYRVKEFNENKQNFDYYAVTSPVTEINSHLIFSNLNGELFYIGNDHNIHPFWMNSEMLRLNSKWKLIYDMNLILNRKYIHSDKLTSLYHNVGINAEPIIVSSNQILFNTGSNLKLYDFKKDSIINLLKFNEDLKLFKIKNDLFIFNYSNQNFFRIYIKSNILEIDRKFESENVTAKYDRVFWNNNMQYLVGICEGSIDLITFKNNHFDVRRIGRTNLNPSSISNIKYNFESNETAVCTYDEGVYIYGKSPFRFVQRKSSATSRSFFFNSHVEIHPGVIYGTWNSTYITDDSNFTLSKKVISFKSAFKANDSTILFHLLNNKFVIYNSQIKLYRTLNYANTNTHSNVAFFNLGDRIMNVNCKGVIEISPFSDQFIAMFPNKMSSSFAKDVAVINDHQIYIGGGQGLFKYDLENQKIEQLSKGIEFDISSLKLYHDKLIICTYGMGLWMYTNGTLKKISNDKFNYLKYSHAVYIDSNKIAWISTNNAILKTPAINLLENTEDKFSKLDARIYDKTNSFPIKELNGGVQGSQILLKNGKLSYAGVNGFLNVDLSCHAIIEKIPSINIEEIRDNENNSYSTESNSVVFPNKLRRIVFTISLPSNNIVHGQLISYRFKNIDSTWNYLDLENTNKIEFNNLPYGHYCLQLLKRNVDTGHIFSKELEFDVEVPWYFSRWAVLGWVMCFGIVIFFVSKWRIYKLKKVNAILQQKVNKQAGEIQLKNIELEKKIKKLEIYQEELESNYAIKNKLIGIVTHDLITPLQFISNSSINLIKNNRNSLSNELQSEIKAISDSTSKMFEKSTDLVEWIKSSTELKFTKELLNLKEMFNEIISQIEPLFRHKSIQFENTIPNETILNCRKAFHILFFQVIMNAAKYTDKGIVIISAIKRDNIIMISVADEGKGMQEKFYCDFVSQIEFDINYLLTANGFGLYIINDMLQILGAQISIKSNKPTGTVVNINISL